MNKRSNNRERSPAAALDNARALVISAIARTMDLYGVTPSVGRIYGVLFFAEGPLSLDEITREVGMSKASVSTGLRELLGTEMVTKVWLKGERKDYYVAERDFFKNFLTFFVNNLRKERTITLRATDAARPILESLKEQTESPEVREKASQDLELLAESDAYFEWIDRLTTAMESGEIFDHYPAPSRRSE